MGTPIEERLRTKALSYLKSHRGLRRLRTSDLFTRKMYIFPQHLKVVNYPRTPVASFNPGAILASDKSLLIFPRLIFDYYTYTSSIGLFKIKLSDVLGRKGSLTKPIETRVILWPKNLWEFRGCEDARVFRNGALYYILYTGYGYMPDEEYRPRIVQGLAKLDENFNVLDRGFFKILGKEREFIPKGMKDSAFIKIKRDKALMLLRPTISNIDVCWRGEASLSNLYIYEEHMEPVLAYEPWEFKVGWSTNVVKLSRNEYIVGWHGFLKVDFSYRNGVALIDDNGELLAITDYLLVPTGIIEEYGDRPLVIFGNGLIKHKDLLLWIGGISDYAIGVFIAELDKIFENLRWVRG